MRQALRGWMFGAVVALGFVAITPGIVLAVSASARDTLNAVAEAQRIGACSSQVRSFGSDCTKTVIQCSSSAWETYVAANYRQAGGSVSFVGQSTGGAGRPLENQDVTQDMGRQASQILVQHLAKFPGCNPPDLSACGIGAEYPLASGGSSFVARIMRHYHPPGGALRPWGDHPGVTLFASTGGGTGAGGEATGYLRADWERNSKTAPGPIQRGTCYCACSGSDTPSACTGKEAGFPYQAGDDLTREECVDRCAPNAIAENKCAGTLASVAAPGAPASSFSPDLCFTSAECSSQKGLFEEDPRCPGKGICIAAEPIIPLSTPIGGVTHIQGFNNYIVTAYRYLLTIVGVVATIMFVWGAFLYLVGAALPSIQRGAEIMKDSVVGLLLVLGATLILRTINPATTQLSPIKVPLINTVQFVNVAYCSDLPGNALMAEAGKRPSLTPYETVAQDPNAFRIPPAQTQCGTSYWLKDNIGGSCEGRRCETPGEACVSCADGLAPGCGGAQSTSQVCARTVMAGTIRYAQQRWPEQVYLMFICGHAQANPDDEDAVDIVTDNWTFEEMTPPKIGFTAAGQVTDAEETGQAAFRFEFSVDDINEAAEACSASAEGNAFRGALLAVQYNDDSVKPEYILVGSSALGLGGLALGATTLSADDIAVISKANCHVGRQALAGYATGDKLEADETDVAEAFLCGVKRGRLLDAPNVYWKEQELREAAEGVTPIICDFTLDSETAPSNPGRACPAEATPAASAASDPLGPGPVY